MMSREEFENLYTKLEQQFKSARYTMDEDLETSINNKQISLTREHNGSVLFTRIILYVKEDRNLLVDKEQQTEVRVYPVLFTNKELKFFDMLGATIVPSHSRAIGQKVEDWIYG